MIHKDANFLFFKRCGNFPKSDLIFHKAPSHGAVQGGPEHGRRRGFHLEANVGLLVCLGPNAAPCRHGENSAGKRLAVNHVGLHLSSPSRMKPGGGSSAPHQGLLRGSGPDTSRLVIPSALTRGSVTSGCKSGKGMM